MTLVVGVDIGNSTTEACAALIQDQGNVEIIGTGLAATTGVKGTLANVKGVQRALARALEAARRSIDDVACVLVNEATPVISGLAMETITETVITESTMIGHNPATPAGVGLGLGLTVELDDLAADRLGDGVREDDDLVVLVPRTWEFDDAAAEVAAASRRGRQIKAAIVQRDDANLIVNRLDEPIPVVDEVDRLDLIPRGMWSAVEVAPAGRSIRTLADTYGLASIFQLDSRETKAAAPVARALVGTRSAVVVRTPEGDVSERVIPAGNLEVVGASRTAAVSIDQGADEIMATVRRLAPLEDVRGDSGTHVGGMLARVRASMSDLSSQDPSGVRIRDVLALDTFVPQKVVGGLAGEISQENAVALAAMVRTDRGAMAELAQRLTSELGVEAHVGGIEANMAVLGALTTPGTDRPVAVIDVGGGSTDAAFADGAGDVVTVHAAGAGDLVTKLIDSELGLGDPDAAENVKKFPVAKAESFHHLRLEDGTVTLLDEPLPPEAYARVVCLTDEGIAPIHSAHPIERIREVRRSAKRRVFVANAVRALEQVAPRGNLRLIDFAIVVGGSALDFEVPQLIAEHLGKFGIVCGTGNVRGTEGPRNAVATGLVLAHARQTQREAS